MLIILAIIIVFVVFVVGVHNDIIGRYNRAKQAWSDIIAQERQKDNILPRLTELCEEYKQFESSLQKNITQLRTALTNISGKDEEFNTELLKQVRSATHSLTGGLAATFEAYPELKATDIYSSLMQEISEQEENVGAAIRIYNSNVQHFNTGIQVFPNNLVNAILTRKTYIKEFFDSKAASAFEYKPNF